MRAAARLRLVAAGAAVLPGCGASEPRFELTDVRAHVERELGSRAAEAAALDTFARGAAALEEIEFDDPPGDTPFSGPDAEIPQRRTALARWGGDSDGAVAVEEALLELVDVRVPLLHTVDRGQGAVERLDIRRLFEIQKRVRPRILARAASGESEAALDLLGAWTEFSRGVCFLGPNGAPIATRALTSPDSTLRWLGLEWILSLDDGQAERLVAALERSPAVAGWAAHGYLSDTHLILEDATAVERELVPFRATFFDPALLAALVDPLAMERAVFRDICVAAITRTRLTEIALRDYAGEWDALAASAAWVASIEAFRSAASGAGDPTVAIDRGALRITLSPDLAARSAAWSVDGEPSVGGTIEL